MSVSFGGGGGAGGTTVTVNVVNSGAIIFISGQAVTISGNCVCISGQPVNISGNFVNTSISGQPVQTTISFSGVSFASNVSGNVVYLPADGVNNVVAISGSIVRTSGQVAQISGQAVSTSISGNVVNVSGQSVFLGSGSVLGLSGLPVQTSVSGNVLAISGTVAVAGAVTTSISGNAVSTSISGNVVAVSGTVTVAGAVTTSVSGNAISASGNWVNITSASVAGFSGLAVTAAVTTNISGQTVYPVSGQGFTYIWDYSGLTWTKAATDTSGSSKLNVNASVVASADISGQSVKTFSSPGYVYIYDYSGQTWTQAATSNSGTNKLLVDAGAIQVAANVSGNVVYLASIDGSGITSTRANSKDHLNVWISGQSVLASVSGNIVSTSVSGNVVALSGTATVQGTVSIGNSPTVVTSVSGNVLAISGSVTTITSISGNVVSVSGLWTSTTLQSGQVGVSGAAGILNFAYDYSGLNWVPIPTANSGVRVPVTTVSGNAVSTSVSGNVVSISGSVATITSISGNVVSVSGPVAVTTSMSGNVISVSGTVTVQGTVTTNISGNTVLNVPSWYGATPVSGWFLKVSGPGFSGANTVGNYIFDFSGQQFVAWASTTSGQGIPYVSIASGLSAQVSGAAISTSVSGNVVAVSGTVTVAGTVSVGNTPAVTTSVSGNYVSIVSGSVAGFSGLPVATSVSGNIIAVSGLWSSTTLQSGQVGVSGAAGVMNFVYDYSGLNWVPMPVANSGVRIPRFTNSGDASTTSISGNVVSISGSVTTITSISGNFVSISGIYFSTAYESGLGAVSGVMGPAGLMAWDLSGLKWNPVVVSNSGLNKLSVDAGSINVASNVSGNVVYVASIEGSGISSTRANSKDHLNAWISGQAVLTSISGNVLAVSGSVTTITSISGNVVSQSGFWSSTTLQSGQTGVSGGQGALNFIYDYSGLNWAPMATSTSGVRILRFTNSGDASTTSVSGNVVSISGSVTTITSISGNTVLPQTPTFIKSADITRYSVASGGTALTAITCVAVTVRNCGVSGDVILVGSLSSPPYFGTSGQAYPAISGLGIWLRDGDAITLNTTSTGNIKVTANLSGTPVSFIAVG